MQLQYSEYSIGDIMGFRSRPVLRRLRHQLWLQLLTKIFLNVFLIVNIMYKITSYTCIYSY